MEFDKDFKKFDEVLNSIESELKGLFDVVENAPEAPKVEAPKASKKPKKKKQPTIRKFDFHKPPPVDLSQFN